MEVSTLGLRCGNGAAGIEFSPLSELLDAIAVPLRGARILIARVLVPGGVLIVQAGTDGTNSERFARLAASLQEAGLTPALQQRQAGVADILIARRP